VGSDAKEEVSLYKEKKTQRRREKYGIEKENHVQPVVEGERPEPKKFGGSQASDQGANGRRGTHPAIK